MQASSASTEDCGGFILPVTSELKLTPPYSHLQRWVSSTFNSPSLLINYNTQIYEEVF